MLVMENLLFNSVPSSLDYLARDNSFASRSRKKRNLEKATTESYLYFFDMMPPLNLVDCFLPYIQRIKSLQFGDDQTLQEKIDLLAEKLQVCERMSPAVLLTHILQTRGYSEITFLPFSKESKRSPSPKQLEDYDNEIVWAIRKEDIPRLEELVANGKCLTACNKYSESIVHMACRRSSYELNQFLLQHGADFSIVDDYGRNPLHDACWRPEPNFDLVELIMNSNPNLIRMCDLRGSSPLNYVREEHWPFWCAFLLLNMDKYWPVKATTSIISITDEDNLPKRLKLSEPENF